ncbi:fimbrial protein [Burkholderia lata]|uniref:fimbrial protein n=1 Tax=Burkholderia lata (strain ATCC 17760 / DSM 23089 / LMG 22485 / NCIMB 9086 / R18194 / 383) TaxID=482957 RepID=UPI0014531964|nr:fimbrial protein [Burkholderia lata]VWC26723.1 type-1 fimbrial protein subunit A [Burkholderia lata]
MLRPSKFIFTLLIPLLGIFGAADATAAYSYCPSPQSPNKVGTWHYKVDNTVIPLNAQNGSVIGSVIFTLEYDCPANIEGSGGFRFDVWTSSAMWKTTPYPGVVKTVTENSDLTRSLGFRVTNMETGKIMSGYIDNYVEWGPPTSSRPTRGTIKMKIELIKLNDLVYNLNKITAYYTLLHLRTVNNGSTGNPAIFSNGVYYWAIGPYLSNTTFTEMQKSCTVTNSDVRVPLQPVAAAKLNAVGMTAGDKGFDIGLSCKPGTNVYVTLTDMTNQGNTGNQLTLTSDSTAQGVKLRILKDGQPVGYGPDSAEIGNLNQWHVGPSATTTRIPLSAQYIATDRVSAGTVKGVATFTMSYQ